MTTCQHCHQPLPEPIKPRRFYLHMQKGVLWAKTLDGEDLDLRDTGMTLVQEVLPIPKEERKPRSGKFLISVNGPQCVGQEFIDAVELTPAVRAALMNAGIEL